MEAPNVGAGSRRAPPLTRRLHLSAAPWQRLRARQIVNVTLKHNERAHFLYAAKPGKPVCPQTHLLMMKETEPRNDLHLKVRTSSGSKPSWINVSNVHQNLPD